MAAAAVSAAPCDQRRPSERGELGVVGYKLSIQDVRVHDTDQGIVAPTIVKATNVTTDHDGMFGLYAGRLLTATNVSASDNTGAGIFAVRIAASGVTASDNGAQGLIVYRHFKVTGLVAQNNGAAGIYSAGGGVLTDSAVSGNVYEGASLDLLPARRPVLRNTTCGVSAQLDDANEPGPSWGVCAGD